MQGKNINGYTIQERLGVGGMAEVWLGENAIGKKAAVKLLLPKFCNDEAIVARFENEAKVMVQLDHPNIRQVYDYGNIDGRPTIIMEYLEGDDLKAMMKSGKRFTDNELRKWWNQIADALNYTHAKGIVHRDIKPSNIFIDKKGNVKLLDFGIAKIKESISMTQTGAMMGTLLYMSPEQVEDSKHIGPESDVYSLAVTFVHLLTGKAPYDSTTSSDYAIRKGIVEIPLDLSDVPTEWQGFLAQYLKKRPEDRPALRPFEAVPLPKKAETPPPIDEDEGTVVENVKKPEPKHVVKSASKRHPEPVKAEVKTPEPTDKPKCKKGLWIGLGVAAAVVALVVSILSGKGVFDKIDTTVTAVKVPVKDIVNKLSNNSYDPTYVQAMQEATNNQAMGQRDFLTLFGDAYERIDPNARLASVFLFELKDKGVNINSSNSEVLLVLREEIMAEMGRRVELFLENNKSELGQRTYSLQPMTMGSNNVDVLRVNLSKSWTQSQLDRFTEFVESSVNKNENLVNHVVENGDESPEYVDRIPDEEEKSVEEELDKKPKNGSYNGHDYVDLGLPSGTLWATCNVGASRPEDYGNYYAWGETKTKSTYDIHTYKYANGDYYKLTKYCSDSNYGDDGFTDKLTTLQAGDDAATANWGDGWRMPTNKQWDELLKHTTNKWTTKNGVAGRLFSAKNGQTLFLPAAGFYSDMFGLMSDGESGDYWSRSLNTEYPYNAWGLFFYSTICSVDNHNRYFGNCRDSGSSVRPVRSSQ